MDPLGLRVLIVEPGAFRTEFGAQRMHRSTVNAVDAIRAEHEQLEADLAAWESVSTGTDLAATPRIPTPA